jgi:hypothetical protein
LRHELGVSGRIDLGARLGPALTACIGVTTRGVRASHGMHGVPGGRRRRQVRTFEHCDTHDRTVFRGAQSLRYPDPEPLDDAHERRLDDVRLGPRQGSDLLKIGDVSARSLPRLPNACPARFPDTVSSKTSRSSPLVSHDDWGISE